MTQHTKEPWCYRKICAVKYQIDFDHSGAGTNEVISTAITEANARRIVACVNACAGIDTDVLELGGVATKGSAACDIALLEARNAELLTALEFLLDEATRTRNTCLNNLGIGLVNEIALERARAAISNAEQKGNK